MKMTWVAAVLLGAMAVASYGAEGKDGDRTTTETKAGKEQTTCPVMGGKIDKALYVDVEGKRIYVCCKGCIAAIKKDPAKYIKKLEEAGVTVEAAPADTNAVKAATSPDKGK